MEGKLRAVIGPVYQDQASKADTSYSPNSMVYRSPCLHILISTSSILAFIEQVSQLDDAGDEFA